MSDARWLIREKAAEHVGYSVSAFNRRVRLGIFPAASRASGGLRWDRQALDAAMTGGTIPASREDAIYAIAAEIRARPKSGAQAPGRRNNQGIPIRARAG